MSHPPAGDPPPFPPPPSPSRTPAPSRTPDPPAPPPRARRTLQGPLYYRGRALPEGGLEVAEGVVLESVGRVEFWDPRFHDVFHIWPVGYAARVKYTPDQTPPVEYRCAPGAGAPPTSGESLMGDGCDHGSPPGPQAPTGVSAALSAGKANAIGVKAPGVTGGRCDGPADALASPGDAEHAPA